MLADNTVCQKCFKEMNYESNPRAMAFAYAQTGSYTSMIYVCRNTSCDVNKPVPVSTVKKTKESDDTEVYGNEGYGLDSMYHILYTRYMCITLIECVYFTSTNNITIDAFYK
jgi:hypothetical protein